MSPFSHLTPNLGPFPDLPETTLCLILDAAENPTRILLGAKLRGLGEGKIVGVGGHVESGETVVEAAVREVFEEVGIVLDPAALLPRARIEFEFPHRAAWRMASNVFLTVLPPGAEAVASEEVRPYWFSTSALPLARMWDDAQYWLPRVIAGESLAAWFEFGADNQRVVRHRIEAKQTTR